MDDRKRRIIIGCSIGSAAVLMTGTGIGVGYAIWHNKNTNPTPPPIPEPIYTISCDSIQLNRIGQKTQIRQFNNLKTTTDITSFQIDNTNNAHVINNNEIEMTSFPLSDTQIVISGIINGTVVATTTIVLSVDSRVNLSVLSHTMNQNGMVLGVNNPLGVTPQDGLNLESLPSLLDNISLLLSTISPNITTTDYTFLTDVGTSRTSMSTHVANDFELTIEANSNSEHIKGIVTLTWKLCIFDVDDVDSNWIPFNYFSYSFDGSKLLGLLPGVNISSYTTIHAPNWSTTIETGYGYWESFLTTTGPGATITHLELNNVTTFNTTFRSCNSLTSADLSSLKPVLNNGNFLPVGAFYSCRNLASVTLPNQQMKLPQGAFQYCPLLSFDFTNVTELGLYACAWGSFTVALLPTINLFYDFSLGSNSNLTSVYIGSDYFALSISDVSPFASDNNLAHFGLLPKPNEFVDAVNLCASITSTTHFFWRTNFEGKEALLGTSSFPMEIYHASYPCKIPGHLTETWLEAYTSEYPAMVFSSDV